MTTATASLYDIPVPALDGTSTTLGPYRGQVLLIVNVASRCGFTPQYDGLESIYRKYRDRGFTVLGFPCNQFLWQEPGGADAIRSCSVKYGVSFPVFGKLRVNAPNAHPLYRHLRSSRRGTLGTRFIKWNFTKFLVDRGGNVVGRFGSTTKPERLVGAIENLLG
jgi:glutathione peroxidase